jgi:hypothetical protein
MFDYTTPLSMREVITGAVGAIVLFALSFSVRWYVYPWLGVPVIGLTGLAPLFVVFGLVSIALLAFRPFRSNGALLLSVSLPLSISLTLLALWSLRGYFAS